MAAKDRKPGPRPKAAKRVQRTIRIPDHINSAVGEYAEARGVPMGDAIVALLSQSLGIDEPAYIEAGSRGQRGAGQQMLRIGA